MEQFTPEPSDSAEEPQLEPALPFMMKRRSAIAHLTFVLFPILTGVGFGLIEVSYGLIAGGIASGIYGYILGKN